MKISVITPTHDPQWLGECFESLKRQTFLANGGELEWVIAVNSLDPDAPKFEDGYPFAPWIRVEFGGELRGVGAVKHWAFGLGTGDVLVELDHDDLLMPTCLERLAEAFADPAVDFAYTDCVDFAAEGLGFEPTYHSKEARAAWLADSWRFEEVVNSDGSRTPYPICRPPTALSLSTILWAPNHVRAWRRAFYERIGGHDPTLSVCDDLDLLQRTYLEGRMVKIDAPLYRYRVHGGNTWIQRQQQIAATSDVLRAKRLHALVAREMELRGLPCVDLGGAMNGPGKPWIPVDAPLTPWYPTGFPPGDGWRDTGEELVVDLSAERIAVDLGRFPWPFADGSIGAFRAFDFLEHIPSKGHMMRELYRCLAPGGWLLSMTPAAALPVGHPGAGTTCQGAFQDPTHCSYWVENSFRYYTEAGLGKYIGNTGPDAVRFMACRLFTTIGGIAYVVADLVSLKGDDLERLPGRRMI